MERPPPQSFEEEASTETGMDEEAPSSSMLSPATTPDDPRVAEAVRLWRKAPALTVVQVMRAVCFPEEDCQSRAKHMWIRRRAPNKKEMRTSPPVRTAAGHADASSPPPPRKKQKVLVPLEGMKKKTPAAPSARATKKSPAPSAPVRRTSSISAQENRVHQRSLAQYKAMVLKKATELYASEKQKEHGMSAVQVREHLSLEYDHVPSERTILRYVKAGLVGAPPLKKGPDGKIPHDVFENLCVAFQTRIRINQLNGEESENSKRKLAAVVNACANREKSRSPTLVNRLLAQTAEGILADVGASTARGGRPGAVFYDPDLPRAGKERRCAKDGWPPPDLGAVAASLERANEAATKFLTENGYRGELMRAKIVGAAKSSLRYRYLGNGGSDPGEG